MDFGRWLLFGGEVIGRQGTSRVVVLLYVLNRSGYGDSGFITKEEEEAMLGEK